MGFDDLRREILHKAFEDVKRINADAAAEESRINAAAETERSQVLNAVKADAASLSAAERGERLAAARLAGKKLVAQAREGLVVRAVEGVRERFYGIVETDAYQKLLNAIVEDGVSEAGRGACVRVNARDKKKVKRFSDAKAGEPVGIAGGAIIESADGRIRVRNTLESLFEENMDVVRASASAALFGDGAE